MMGLTIGLMTPIVLFIRPVFSFLCFVGERGIYLCQRFSQELFKPESCNFIYIWRMSNSIVRIRSGDFAPNPLFLSICFSLPTLDFQVETYVTVVWY